MSVCLARFAAVSSGAGTGSDQIHCGIPEPSRLERHPHRDGWATGDRRRQPGGAVHRPGVLVAVVAELEPGQQPTREVAAQSPAGETGAAGRLQHLLASG